MTKTKSLNQLYIASFAIIAIIMILPFMGEINSYIFICIFFTLPIASGVWCQIKVRESYPKWGLYLLSSTILCYICVILSVWSIGNYYEYQLYKYDLDGDGMFSGAELTPEMDQAMKRLTNDTGRTFAPIIGAIVSPFYNILWFLFFALLTWIRSLAKI